MPPNREIAPRLVSAADLLDEFIAEQRAAHEARETGRPLGPRIALRNLSALVGDGLRPGIVTIHGQPGTGKTAFGLQVAADSQVPTLFVTAEMSPLALLTRLVARHSRQYLGRFRGEMAPETAAAYAQAALAAVPHLAFGDATVAWASPNVIQEWATSVRGSHLHLLIVLDSLHAWSEGGEGAASEYEQLNAGIAALRTLAHVLSCTIMVICERNRMSMEKGGLSAAAGTRKVEYVSELVFDLSAKDDPAFNSNGEKEVTLKIVKNRHGTCDRVELLFHGACQSFRER